MKLSRIALLVAACGAVSLTTSYSNPAAELTADGRAALRLLAEAAAAPAS